jgi:hypothetical protein
MNISCIRKVKYFRNNYPSFAKSESPAPLMAAIAEEKLIYKKKQVKRNFSEYKSIYSKARDRENMYVPLEDKFAEICVETVAKINSRLLDIGG